MQRAVVQNSDGGGVVPREAAFEQRRNPFRDERLVVGLLLPDDLVATSLRLEFLYGFELVRRIDGCACNQTRRDSKADPARAVSKRQTVHGSGFPACSCSLASCLSD